MQCQVIAALFRPPRWNFAQVCGWCMAPWCASVACIAKHEASWWGPCPDCVGGAGDEIDCGCLNGVIQANSQDQAERLIHQHLRALQRVARRRAQVVRRAA